MTDHQTITPAVLRPKAAALYLGIAVQTLANMRSAGVGPAYRLHGRSVLYLREDLDQYLTNLPAGRAA